MVLDVPFYKIYNEGPLGDNTQIKLYKIIQNRFISNGSSIPKSTNKTVIYSYFILFKLFLGYTW